LGPWSSGSPRGWLPRYPPNTGRPQPPFRRTRQERHEEVDHLGIGLPNRSEPAMGVDRRGVWVPTLVPLVEHSADGPLRGTIGRHDGHLGEEALSGPAARQGQASGYGKATVRSSSGQSVPEGGRAARIPGGTARAPRTSARAIARGISGGSATLSSTARSEGIGHGTPAYHVREANLRAHWGSGIGACSRSERQRRTRLFPTGV